MAQVSALQDQQCPENLPWMQANISDKTLPVTARHFDGTLEYNAHNLYGAYEVKATAEALRAIRNKRHFVFTRYASALRQGCEHAHLLAVLQESRCPVRQPAIGGPMPSPCNMQNRAQLSLLNF